MGKQIDHGTEAGGLHTGVQGSGRSCWLLGGHAGREKKIEATIVLRTIWVRSIPPTYNPTP